MNRYLYLEILKKERCSVAKLAKDIGLSENYIFQIMSKRRAFSDKVLKRLIDIDDNALRKKKMFQVLQFKGKINALPKKDQTYGVMFINEALIRSELSPRKFAMDALNMQREYFMSILSGKKPVSTKVIQLVETYSSMKFEIYKAGLINQEIDEYVKLFGSKHLLLNALNVYFNIQSKKDTKQ